MKAPKLPKLNIRLLNRIVKHLKAEPKRYYQANWGRVKEGPGAPACHTQGCIAGWAVFLSVPKSKWGWWRDRSKDTGIDDVLFGHSNGIPRKARSLLGLTDAEAYRLFAVHNQGHVEGEAGVHDAEQKINDLIADRAAFIEKW